MLQYSLQILLNFVINVNSFFHAWTPKSKERDKENVEVPSTLLPSHQFVEVRKKKFVRFINVVALNPQTRCSMTLVILSAK